MKIVALLFLFSGLPGLTFANEVSPVQKVIQLLEGMVEKGTKEQHDEQVQFAKFKRWCDNTAIAKTRQIKENNEKIETLDAQIEKHGANIEKRKAEIAEHAHDIDMNEQDVEATAAVREMEEKDYQLKHKDLTESVSALGRAITVLKERAAPTKQEALIQVAALSLIPAEAKKTIDIFLQQEPSDTVGLGVSAPEAHGYEFQSSGVVDMLEKLEVKFVKERTDLENSNIKDKHSFAQYTEATHRSIDRSETSKSDAELDRDDNSQKKSVKTSEMEEATRVRDADKAFLEDTVATCETKATNFDSRQRLRTEEIAAVHQAIEILSSDAVSGSAEKHLPSFAQGTPALAQLRSTVTKHQDDAATYLHVRAAQLNSHVLETVATHVSGNPFKKVNKMIQDLITKLMQEATEEAEHKGWCDTELGTNLQTRTEKTENVERLTSEIDQLTASVATLGEEIAELSKDLAKLDSDLAERTQMRTEEHEKNEQTIKDAKAAQVAVAQALTVLKEFYAKAAEATAFVQKRIDPGTENPEQPEIFDEPYTGLSGEKGGVVGMLEVIESDFARLEAETQSDEENAVSEHNQFVTDTKVDKASKSTSKDHKEKQKSEETQAISNKNADLEGTQKELDAANDYYDKLKKSCIDAGVSYEERVARRREEIESLQQALQILNGEEFVAAAL